ncbi:MAG: alkaline phosphatase family protein [Euryarchaeota archaeon]|nr:alkaline phosphatase family protein [Euryarchaeota archaeon]
MSVKPDYRRGVYNVPHTILHRLGVHDSRHLPGFSGTARRVVLFVIDALGLSLFKECMSEEFELTETLTSVFPSTTAAAVTTLFTGLSPREHGVLEWYMRYECTGEVIKTIPFSGMDEEAQDTLVQRCAPGTLFPSHTIFSRLSEQGLKTSAYLRSEYINSSYSRSMLAGARPVGFGDETEIPALLERDDADFIYVYIDTVDYMQHIHGPQGAEVRREVRRVAKILKRSIAAVPDAEFFITADHGQIAIQNRTVLAVPENCMVAGSPRDMFLYCPYEPEGYKVIRKREFLELLGPGEHEHPFINYRAPERVVLPDDGSGVWFREFDAKGLHGGMSEHEMLVPLIHLD